ncbi:tRNA (adenosine(37)-N6)-threonylcarbamoyltransferase complex ATPase subunit type 1 TsaE [Patulibacter americanus]|uniref:tRNA (adenosine(37)-N6)-threonylcarbamoyltransferase complex ATPase subunit type 1 TsaE n=1 Tax=Patulibacter americanus TaxID=588672 RepID=UPI0003B6D71F|nr:tRNA (adenosine(37)-N6)-threonylcarbamoyltransferase complex ATPase subunit type 1 TsaE [Patulibacter americanus]
MRPAREAPGDAHGGEVRAERRSTADPDATAALGAEIAARLRAGDVVLLRGDLGAGKTTLVRGAAAALGATARVTSPTFALAHRYDGDGVRIAHLDLYRLRALGEEDEDLIADELTGDVVAFVEWPEPMAALIADRVVLEVELEHAGDDAREAVLRWKADRT